MDEIEFKQLYNEACGAAGSANAPSTHKALHLILQLVWDLHERILEMQVEDDDE